MTTLYDDATIEDMYTLIRRTYEGNNWAYGLKVEFLEEGKSTGLTLFFRGTGGFREDQRERRGVIETLDDKTKGGPA